jgi:subtilisin-like proprotein convertase family protein
MKKIYLIAVVILATYSADAQNFFFEDFDACELPAGWTNTAVLGDTVWSIGDNAVGTPAGSVDGSCMAYVHDDDLTGAFGAIIMDLETPVIDLSSLDTGLLQFEYIFEDLGASYFAVALWNGAAWDTVFTENSDPGCFGFFPTCGPRSASIDLSGYLNADFKAKFIYDDGDAWSWFIGLDNVAVYVPPTDDGDLVAMINPVTGCGLSATEPVGFSVYNNGQSTITSIDISYSVNGNPVVSETFVSDILSAETDTFDLLSTVDLSVPGTYTIQAWITVAGDPDATNDTIVSTLESIPVISSLPYMQDFEAGAGGWTSGGVLDSWELGDPETAFIDTAASGVNAWVTNLDGVYENGTDAYVESPCFDFSSLSVDPVFRFAFITNSEINYDGTWAEVSTDAGLTWSTVGAFGEGTNWYTNEDEHGVSFDEDWYDEAFGLDNEWTVATHLLDGAAGSGSVKIRMFFHSDGSVNGFDGFAFDDIEIFEQPSINAGVIEILSPTSGCGLGSELVTVVMENFGDANLVDFLVEYDAGSGLISEMVTDTLFAASIDTFTFVAPVDLSVVGNYDLGAWTAIVGDGDILNDSLFTSVYSSPVITGLPYMEDFEAGDGGWFSTGTNGAWELGDPEGLLIDTAASGVNAWATNLDSVNYNIEQLSYLTSPCFDLSALSIDPILEFGLISNSEAGWDGAWLESSTDGGTTWATVGNVGEGINWYTNNAFFGPLIQGWDGNTADTVGWVVAEHLLDGVAGSSDVIIRFVFNSDDFIVAEGFAIDDILITEQPAINSEVTAIVSPESGCNLTATEAIMVHVTNLGSEVMDSVIIGYTFDNGVPMTEIFNNSVAVGSDTVFTLTNTLDLSAFGDYDLVVWTGTIGDGDNSNDTMSVVVTSIPTISTLPYLEDFENGTGGWTSAGANNSWELGDPQGAFIDTANSGVNAWVTNLTGPYNLDEESFVESPCIDFSALTDDPVLSFAHIYNTEQCCDEGWIDLSLDGGATWTKLGLFGEGENWYNDNFDEFWNGTSGDATVWRNAEHILTGTAGMSDVKIRFMFSSDLSITAEGFGVDDISIAAQAQLDLVALSLDGPNPNCDLGMEEVSMTFWNKGLVAVSNFDLGFIVDAGTTQTEVYTASVNSGDTVSYTFTTEMADLSAAGGHTIDVFTALTGDEDLDSDTLSGNVVTNHGNLTPLAQTEMPESAISSTLAEGTTSQMFFCGLPTSLDGCLQIESVVIDSLQHTFLSDLDIFLISPAGDTVELSTDNGGAGDDIFGLVFTDTATNDITLQTVGILPGYYATEDTTGFAGLYNGQNPNGAWSLFIQDDAGGDDGTLLSWSMTFVDNSPTPVLAYSDTTICLSHVLDLTIDEYDSYLWSTGHNTQTAELFGDVIGLGTYTVSVTVDLNGCTGISNSFELVVDACLGVEELGDLSIDVYPNPSNGQVVLDITGDSDGLTLSVMDVNGKRVYSESTGTIISGLRKTVDLTNLANGMYFLKLDNGTSYTTKKIIKQ